MRVSLSSGLAALLAGLSAGPGAAQDRPDSSEGARAIDVVVVTGIRGSLDRAKQTKRLAPNVVDAVSMEDLGQFTDDSAIDALQRIPGVQVQRDETGGGGSFASIRGLGPQFVEATVNGRSLYGFGLEGASQLRSFSFDTVPTEVISGIVVAKTPTAAGGRSGIAGAIDLQTLRPLDVPFGRDGDSPFFGTVSPTSIYDGATDESGYRLATLIGGRFNDDTLGAFASLVLSDEDTARGNINTQIRNRTIAIDNTGDGLGDENRDLTLLVYDYNPIEEERSRVAATGGLQWRPSERLDVNLDVLYTEYDVDSTRQRALRWYMEDLVRDGGVYDAAGITIQPLPIGANGALEDVLTRVAPGARLDDTTDTVRMRTGPQRFDNRVDMYVVGGNVAWSSGANTLELDLYHQDMEFYNTFRRADFWDPAVPAATLGYDISGGQFTGVGYAEAFRNANYVPQSTFARERTNDTTNSGLQLDYVRELDDGFVTHLRFGASYQIGDIEQRTSPNAPGIDLTDPANAQLFITSVLGNLGAAELYTDQNVIGYLQAGSYDALEEAFPDILGGSYFGLGDPAEQFDLQEEILGAYGQIDFERGNLTGNVGLQIVQTKTEGTGVVAFVPGLAETDGSFTDFLPSLNLNASLSDNVNLRFGVSRVVSRPDPSEIVPRTRFFGNTTAFEIESATAGNPDLEPFTTDQIDVTLEWYTPNDGTVYASVFYKDVSDFIFVQPVPDADIILPAGFTIADDFFANQPVNIADGSVAGLELNVTQPLPMIVEGLGVIFNYTYVDGKLKDVPGQAGDVEFPGASENNFNTSLYYEGYGFSAKVSYTYRDAFLRALAGTDLRGDSNRFSDDLGLLDATLSYAATDNVEFRVSGTNLTGEDRLDYANVPDVPLSILDSEAVYTFGVNIRW